MHHLLFNLSDLMCMVLEAQRHVIRGAPKEADKVLAAAQILLATMRKQG